MGLGRKGETELECPFCRKGNVKTFHKEGYLQARTSRISAGAKTKHYKTPDTYEVLEDCSHCGAKKKDIQASFEGKYKKKMTHQERIEMLKKRGLPLVLGSEGG